MALPYVFSSGTLIASAQVNANFAAVALTDFSNTSNTGSGNNVLSISPTLVAPALGTPISVTLTNATGLPLTSGVSGILPVLNGGTGTASPSLVQGSGITITGTWPNQTISSSISSYPGAGIANSTGSAWGTSYSTTGTGTVVALATSPSLTTPGIGAGGALFAGSSFTVTLKASASTTGSYTFTLPVSGGTTSGYVLTTDGAGTTSWSAPASGSGLVVGGSPITGGTSGYILYVNGSTLGNIQTIPTANGGTNLTSFTSGGAVYATATNVLTTGTLPVASGGTGTATAFTAGSVHFSGAAGVYSQNNAQFFWDNTNYRLGVGTSSPATSMHIQQSVDGEIFRVQRSGGTNIPILQFILSETNNVATISETGAAAGAIAFQTGGSERMRITAAGLVGIGASSPGTTLSVVGSVNGNDGVYYTNTSTGASAQAIVQVATNGANGWQFYQNYTTKVGGIYSGDSAAFTFSTAATERMRITPTGLVGIGTNNPQRILDVEQSGVDYQFRLGDAGGSNYYDIGRVQSNGLLTFYGSQAVASGFVFTTVNGERLRIASSGEIYMAAAQSPTQIYDVGYLGIPVSGGSTKTTSYTAVLTDAGQQLQFGAASLTGTIPANASVAYPVGTTLIFVNLYSGNLTIAINSDTLYLANSGSTGSRTLAGNYGVATALKIGSTSWVISGNGLS